MHIDISYNIETDQIDIIYDDSITLSARLNNSGKVSYSKNFEQLDDEKSYNTLKKFCELMLEPS